MHPFFRLVALSALLAGGRPAAPARAQSLAFDRAVVCGTGANYNGWGPSRIVVDALGNTYVTGTFNGTIVLGNTLLTATQVSPGYNAPMGSFVAKLDAAGNYVWAAQTNDGQDAFMFEVAVDAAGGVYVVGSFTSFSARFGIGGPIVYNSSALSEGFVAKLDGGTGQWLWARRAGGTGNDYLQHVAVNPAGEVCVVGRSLSPVTDAGPFTLAGAQNFLARLSPAGVWLGAQAAGSQPLGSIIPDIIGLALDAQGNVYLSGNFGPPAVSFGATTLATQVIPGSPSGGSIWPKDIFVAKLSPAGAWLWAVQGDAVTHQNLLEAGSLAYDGAGHLYVAGAYESTAARIGGTVLPNLSRQFPQPNPAPTPPYTNNYQSDAFVARLDVSTGAWDWAVRNGGLGSEVAGQSLVDAQGGVYVGGFFTDAAGAPRSFAQLDGATGAWRGFRTPGPGVVRAMVLDGQGRLHLAGFFDTPTATFGPVTLAQAGPGQSTGFVARGGAGPLSARAGAGPTAGLAVWPNPAGGGAVWVQGPAPGQAVQVLDALGRMVGSGRMPVSGPLRLEFGAGLALGLYVVRSGGQARRLVVEQ